MKHIKIILGLVLFATVSTFAQSPRIKLNQITKDSLTGSVLISSPTDSGMVYSRDLFISYGADTVLILGGDTLAATSGIISSVLSDGVTITGDGTVGSELTVDTATVIATKKDLSDYVTIAEAETITGAKTFSTDVEIDGKLDLNDGVSSVFIGQDAGSVDDGSNNQNVGIGINSLKNVTSGFQNIAIGANSLENLTNGSNNMAIGFNALKVHNIASGQNAAIGGQSLASDTTGVRNSAIGYQSLFSNNGGNNNIAIGWRSGRFINSGAEATKNDNSVFLGYDARPQLDLQSNQIVIGYLGRGLGSNTAIIGNSSLTDIYNGADNANFSTVSDARDKKNIQPLELGLNLIEKLNPVAFVWDKRDSTRVGVKDIGFIAQEFDGALYALPHSEYADFVKITEDGSWKLNLSDIYPVIVKAIQEQQAIIENQSTEIETLKTLITELSNRLTILENN